MIDRKLLPCGRAFNLAFLSVTGNHLSSSVNYTGYEKHAVCPYIRAMGRDWVPNNTAPHLD